MRCKFNIITFLNIKYKNVNNNLFVQMTKNVGVLLTTLDNQPRLNEQIKRNTNKSSKKSLTKEQMCGIM